MYREKMDVHRGVGTYTIRVAHWFESSFTGNNAPFNTNGIQCKMKTNGRSLSVLCTGKKMCT